MRRLQYIIAGGNNMNPLFFSEVAETTPNNNSFDWKNLLNQIWYWMCTQGLRLVLGLVVVFILFKVINVLSRSIKKRMENRHHEPTITMVVYNVTRIGLKLLVFVLFISYVGIDTAGIGAIISSIGIGFSLAVQGSLSNFAGGLVIIVMKPFRLGDYISAQGCEGTVENIKLFYTYVTTPDNKVQMIPNGTLANGVIVNVSMKDTRRVDMVFGISYNSSVSTATEVIKNVIEQQERIFRTPEPQIVVGELADSSVNLKVRVWVKKEDYWDVFFNLNSTILEELVKNGVQIPYPQLDVHLDSKGN